MLETETPQATPAPKAALTVDEFCYDNNVGRTTAYKEIAAGRLRTMKIGAKRLISREAGQDWRLLMEEAAGKTAENGPA